MLALPWAGSADPKLILGEDVKWRSPPGIVDRTGHGGTLYVTSARVMYLDNRLEPRRVNREWPVDDVAAISVAAPDGTLYTGGLHRRLRMTLRDGETVLFNVSKLDSVVEQLQNLLLRPEASNGLDDRRMLAHPHDCERLRG